MYDYQAQTSLPPIRARQQRPSGVQVQQLYESSPVLAAIAHHPSTTHFNSHKNPPADSSTITNGNTSLANNNYHPTTSNGTTNGYHNHSHHHHHHTTQAQPSDQSMRKSPSVDSMMSMHSSSQPRRSNALDPDAAMKTYMSKLTAYERHEIFSYPQIYFVGQNARKRQGVNGAPNNGKKAKSFQSLRPVPNVSQLSSRSVIFSRCVRFRSFLFHSHRMMERKRNGTGFFSIECPLKTEERVR